MAISDDVWHLVEGKRDDGTPAVFRIRQVEPRPDQPEIFVVEIPYPLTELSRLPNAAAYRRLAAFEEQWLVPACHALGMTFVASKTEDGSCFVYLYGSGDATALVEKLSPFDGALGFFDDHDPEWAEYAALREILDEARAISTTAPTPAVKRSPKTKPRTKSKTRATPTSKRRSTKR